MARPTNPTSTPAKEERAVGWLRWACVLPAAVLGRVSAQLVAEVVGRLAVSAWGRPAESAFVDDLLLLLLSIPKEAGFVVAGAKMAPRGRLATAIVLAVAGVLMSLIVHIVGQANPGITKIEMDDDGVIDMESYDAGSSDDVASLLEDLEKEMLKIGSR